MITKKDLAPIDSKSFELWRKELSHRKTKTLWDLYLFCQDFYSWFCIKGYVGYTCNDCTAQEDCLRYKLTIVEVNNELVKRSFLK